MKIFVTGGAGFIGSHTCVELLDAGYEVVIADNLSNAKPEAVENIQKIAGKPVAFYPVDLRDKEGVRKIFADHLIDAVIHFAGLKAVPESVHKPLEYYENNLGSTFVLCQVMREAGCRRIVFSSSATVYGTNNPVPFKEGMPTSATNPYGYTKVMIEQILTDLAAADPRWSVSLLRYFNPIGAHPSGLIGEDPNGIPNNLLPYVSQVAAGLRPEVVVYGRLPLMHLLHCPERAWRGKCAKDCFVGCSAKPRALTDRRGVEFALLPLTVAPGRCNVQVLNSLPLDGLRVFGSLAACGASAWRLNFTTESGAEVKARLAAYRQALAAGEVRPLERSTAGRFARGFLTAQARLQERRPTT